MTIREGSPLRIGAADWNAMRELVRRQAGIRPGAVVPTAFEPWHENTIIRVRNESGAPCRRWDVLGIGEPLITPAQNIEEFFSVSMRGMLPAAQHKGKFCVLLEPLAANAIGRAVIVGAVPVRLDEPPEGATGSFADIRVGKADKLKRGNKGVPIVWLGDVEADPTDDGQFRWGLINLTPGAGGASQTDLTCCGCNPTECMEFGWWELAENNCPHALLLTVDDDMECCNGDAGGSHVLQFNAGNSSAPARYIGPGFTCGSSGRDCGTTTYVWQTTETCGSVTYQFGGEPCGSRVYTYQCQTFQQEGGTVTVCSWIGSGECGDGCVEGTATFPPSPFPGQQVSVPCVSADQPTWIQISGNCSCGTAPAPTEPGTVGQQVTVACEFNGDPGRWVAIANECECGNPVPPTEPGSIQGEITTTSCVDPDAQPECGTATWQFFACEGTTFVAELLQSQSGQPQMHWQIQSSNCGENGTANPPCGAAAIHTAVPPVTVGQTQTEPCELDGWELIENDCICGTPIPPRAYATHGDIITRPCESPIVAFWRLMPPSPYAPAEVQFVVQDEVKIRYRLPPNRSWCCKCQSRWDIVVDEPCRWPCHGIPQSVCVRPVKTGGPPGGATCGDLANRYSLLVQDFNEIYSASGNIPTTGITGINGNWTMSLLGNDTGGCGQADQECGQQGSTCCTYLEESGAKWVAQTCSFTCEDADPSDCSDVTVATRYNCGGTSIRLYLGVPSVFLAFGIPCSPGVVEWCRKKIFASGSTSGGCGMYTDILETYEQIDVLDDGTIVLQRGQGAAECPVYLLMVPIS